MSSIIPLFFSFLIVVLLTPIVIKISFKLNLVDKPDNHRKIHKKPIPRTGGVVIFFTFIWLILTNYPNLYELRFLIVGSFTVFILGLYDDIIGIRWYYKFVIQFISAAFLILYFSSKGIDNFTLINFQLPGFILYPIIFLLIVGGLNALNLLDGIDGLVTSFSLLLSFILFLVLYGFENNTLKFLLLLIIGVSLGFLKYNMHPATIFLGDSGSLFLAFILINVVFLSSIEINDGKIDLVYSTMIFAVPIIDTLRVMYERIIHKKNPFLPDKNHIHHIFQKYDVDQKFSVLFILIISLVSYIISFYYVYKSKLLGIVFFAIYILLFINFKFIIKNLINVKLFKNGIKSLTFIPYFIKIFYFRFFIKIILLLFIFFVSFLLFYNDLQYKSINGYFTIFIFFSVIYSFYNLIRSDHYSEMLVFINFIILFLITNSYNIFYNSVNIPIIGLINFNKVIIVTLIFTIIFYFLLRDPNENKRITTLFSSLDLILFLITFSLFFFTEFINLNITFEKFNDVFLRSFLFYLVYKIFIHLYPRLHKISYISTYLFTLIAIIQNWF